MTEQPVTARDLKGAGRNDRAAASDALMPNLVQTLEGYARPSSTAARLPTSRTAATRVMATRMAHEAWRTTPSPRPASAQIWARKSSLTSSAAVQDCARRPSLSLRQSARSKCTSGAKTALDTENLEALEKGLPNLLRHVSNITRRLQASRAVVAVNALPDGHGRRGRARHPRSAARSASTPCFRTYGQAAADGRRPSLPAEVVRLCEENRTTSRSPMSLTDDRGTRSKPSCKNVYRGDGVVLTPAAKKQIARSRRSALASFRSALPRRSTAFRTTRQNAVRRRASP